MSHKAFQEVMHNYSLLLDEVEIKEEELELLKQRLTLWEREHFGPSYTKSVATLAKVLRRLKLIS